jgi:hypothetical protein
MTEDPYLIPGTEVLRNIPGLTNTAQLEEFEANMAAGPQTPTPSTEPSSPPSAPPPRRRWWARGG